jgi:hypothetical protein
MNKTLTFVTLLLSLVIFSANCLNIKNSKICPCSLVNTEDSFVQKHVTIGSFVQKIVNIDKPQAAFLQKAVFFNNGIREEASTTTKPLINGALVKLETRRALRNITGPIKTITSNQDDDLEVVIN